MARNIQINYKGEDGSYEVLYPNITINNVSNLQSDLNSLQSQINQKLSLSGGTMTGNLMLNGNPSSTNQAANKGYVDNQIDNSKNYTDTEITSISSVVPFRILDRKTISVTFSHTSGGVYNSVDFYPLFTTDKFSSSWDYYSIVFVVFEFNLSCSLSSSYENIYFYNTQETNLNIGPIKIQGSTPRKNYVIETTSVTRYNGNFGVAQIFYTQFDDNYLKVQPFNYQSGSYYSVNSSNIGDISGEISSYFVTFS